MVYVSSPPPSGASPHLCLLTWQLSFIKQDGRMGGGVKEGGFLHLLWGPVQAHETAGVLQKPIIEAPAPPTSPGRTGGGRERDC